MTHKDTLKVIKQDIKDKFSEISRPEITLDAFSEAYDNLKEGAKIMGTSSAGMVVGAIQYAPFTFAMPTFMRRNSKKKISIDESDASYHYRFGKSVGGGLSSLAIHGGVISHLFTHPNFIRNSLIYAGGITCTNVLSQGYEYWRKASERAKAQKDKENNLELEIKD